MRKIVALAVFVPALAFAIPVHQVCDQSGNCAPISSTDGITVKLTTQTVNTSWIPAGATRWTCSLAGLAASLTECQALAAARVYYVTDIVVQTTTATAGSYAIQTGTGTNCGSTTAALFPVNSTAARFIAPISTQPTAVISLTTPLVSPAGAAICVIGTATNTINIQISGYYL